MARPGVVSKVVEKGDVFFFYRPRFGVVEVNDLSQVQRLYVMLAPRQHDERRFRIFMVGGRRLPNPIPGRSDPRRPHWMLLLRTTTDPDVVRDKLSAKRWETVVRGERALAAARPVGEGRYRLLAHEDHSELAYVLEHPCAPAPVAKLLNVADHASYITAIRNPDLPGRRTPCYPRELRARFGEARWLPVTDSRLLDYTHARLLLLGRHQTAVLRQELGLSLAPDKLLSNDVFDHLRLDRQRHPPEPVFKGHEARPHRT